MSEDPKTIIESDYPETLLPDQYDEFHDPEVNGDPEDSFEFDDDEEFADYG